MKTTIKIQGTHCPSCKILIEEICMEQKGVISAGVNYHTGETLIEHDESLNWQKLKDEVEAIQGYTVSL
ncbi:heavy-metal-associated domain-containing protein [Candidatus Uhrbacteria bacterium]|nr:heavy-metal-associated domain-containing protein [Candidatus Uhrbacteria bacterium]